MIPTTPDNDVGIVKSDK